MAKRAFHRGKARGADERATNGSQISKNSIIRKIMELPKARLLAVGAVSTRSRQAAGLLDDPHA